MNERNTTKVRQIAAALSILSRLQKAHANVSGDALASAACALLDDELEAGVKDDVLKVARCIRDLRTPPTYSGASPRNAPVWVDFRLNERYNMPVISRDGEIALRKSRCFF